MNKKNKGPTLMGQFNGIAPSPRKFKTKNSAIIARRPRPACRSRTYPRFSRSSTKWSVRAVETTAKRTKAWRTSKSCLAQASDSSDKGQINKNRRQSPKSKTVSKKKSSNKSRPWQPPLDKRTPRRCTND